MCLCFINSFILFLDLGIVGFRLFNWPLSLNLYICVWVGVYITGEREKTFISKNSNALFEKKKC